MQHRQTTLVVLILFSIITSCHRGQRSQLKIQPAKVEKREEGATLKVVLTADAANRLGIESIPFKRDSARQQVIPLSALIYDNDGGAWVFTNPFQQNFHRERIRILHSQGDRIRIESGITDEVPIVTQGVAELYGVESGVGK